MTDLPKLLTSQETADYLGIPLQTLYIWRVNNKGPKAYIVGRYLRYAEADIAAWLEGQKEQ